jgi:DNA-binding Xre family transcriptional regulator
MPSKPTFKPLWWQLHLMMAKRRIKTNAELHRRLRDVGYDITSGQLGRLVDAKLPQRLTIELLQALMTVLDCGLDDLLTDVEPDDDEPQAVATSRRAPGTTGRQPRLLRSSPPSTDLTGPKVTALPRVGE